MQAGFALTQFFLISLAVVLAGVELYRSGRDLDRSSLDTPILAFALVAVFSTLQSIDPITSVLGRYNDYANGLVGMGLCACAFYIGKWSEGYATEDCLKTIAAVGVLAVLAALAQNFGLPGAPPLASQGARISGASGHPVHFGTFMGMVAPLFLVMHPRWPRWGYLFVIGSGLFMSLSRGGALAACAGAGLAYYLTAYGAMRRKIIAIAAISLAMGCVLLTMRSDTAPSDTFRLESYRVAWVQFKKKPILGTGPATFLHSFRRYRRGSTIGAVGSFRRVNAHAHNDIAQVGATMGLAGLVAWAYLLIAAGLIVWRKIKFSDGRGGAVAGLLLALFVSIKFNPPTLALNTLACLCLGLILRQIHKPRFVKTSHIGAVWPRGFTKEDLQTKIFRQVKGLVIIAIGIASLIVAFSICRADIAWQYSNRLRASGAFTGAFLFARQAAHLNPWNEVYKIGKWNIARDMIRLGVPREALLRESAADSISLAELRPLVFDGHYLAGITALNIARSGDGEMWNAAKNALMVGRKLNPRHEQVNLLLNVARRGKIDFEKIKKGEK